MIAIVITAVSFIWPLVVLVVGAVIWHTRGRHARALRLQLEAEHREYRALVDAAERKRSLKSVQRMCQNVGEVNQLLSHEAVCPRLGPDGKCNCGSR